MVEYILTQIFVSQWSKNEIFSNFNQEFIHKLHSIHTIFMHRTKLFFFSNWNFFNIKHAEIRKREKNAQLIGRCFTCDSFGFRWWCWFNEPHWYYMLTHFYEVSESANQCLCFSNHKTITFAVSILTRNFL